MKLHHWILIAMVLGAGIGLPLNMAGAAGSIDPETVATVADIGKRMGDVFLRALQMLVVPLIVSSLISGVTGMGDLRQLGSLGGRTMLFYVSTSALAIVTGLVFVNLIQPGVGMELGLPAGDDVHMNVASEEAQGVAEILWNQFYGMIPRNPLSAAAEGKMLPLIFFSILLGVFITFVEHSPRRASDTDTSEEDADTEHEVTDQERLDAGLLRRFFNGLFAVMMKMTMAVIQLAPFGVFGFMLYAAAARGIDAFEALGAYALTVFLALAFHAVVTIPLIIKFVGKTSPLAHAKAMVPALLTAFSTASSNGTLPLTMRSVEKSGVPNHVSSFVLPLGATINMDGTALYEAIAVLFIANVTGHDLTLAQQVIVAITALLASVGAAGIPHAGTVMMVVVLGAVGLPTEGVALILAVDRILDMGRTAVNVWSDSAAARVVTRFTTTPEAATADRD